VPYRKTLLKSNGKWGARFFARMLLQGRITIRKSLAMLKEMPLAILPKPTEQEVKGFISLYRTKYGIDLDPAEVG